MHSETGKEQEQGQGHSHMVEGGVVLVEEQQAAC